MPATRGVTTAPKSIMAKKHNGCTGRLSSHLKQFVSMALPEFQLQPPKKPFLALYQLKLPLISLVKLLASHAGNRGSKPLRGANEINKLGAIANSPAARSVFIWRSFTCQAAGRGPHASACACAQLPD